jgi:hypothetical protein
LAILGAGVSEPKLLVGEGAILGVGLAAALIGKLAKRVAQHRENAQPNEDKPSTDLALSPNAVYEMAIGSVVSWGVNKYASIAISLGAGLLGALLLGLSIEHPEQFSIGSSALFAILLIGGLAFALYLIPAREPLVIVDAGGIRKQWMRSTMFIPWEVVESVRRRQE